MDRNKIWFVIFWLLIVEFFAGTNTGIHRGLYSLFTREILLVSSFAQIGFVVSIFGLAKSFTNLGIGSLSDKIGRKPTILLGLILTGFGGLLISVSAGYNDMLTGTALMGVGSGSYAVGIMVSINEIITSARRGLAMGLFELAAYGGQTFGTTLGGYIAITGGLRLPFSYIIVIASLGAVTCFFLVPETKVQKETRDKAPSLKDHGFSRTPFRYLIPLYIAGFSSKILDSFVWSFLPLYLKGLQLSLMEITFITSAFTLSWALSQPLAGHISDRRGRKSLVLIGLVSSTINILLYSLTSNFIIMLILALILGFGTALFYTPLLAMVGDLAPLNHAGTLLGSYRFFRDLGYLFGPILLGVVADTYGFNYTFYITSLSLLIATIIVYIFSRETRVRGV